MEFVLFDNVENEESSCAAADAETAEVFSKSLSEIISSIGVSILQLPSDSSAGEDHFCPDALSPDELSPPSSIIFKPHETTAKDSAFESFAVVVDSLFPHEANDHARRLKAINLLDVL